MSCEICGRNHRRPCPGVKCICQGCRKKYIAGKGWYNQFYCSSKCCSIKQVEAREQIHRVKRKSVIDQTDFTQYGFDVLKEPDDAYLLICFPSSIFLKVIKRNGDFSIFRRKFDDNTLSSVPEYTQLDLNQLSEDELNQIVFKMFDLDVSTSDIMLFLEIDKNRVNRLKRIFIQK